MKIICPCTNIIADTTDFIAQKAYRIADQDWEDMTIEINTVLKKLSDGKIALEEGQYQAVDVISSYMQSFFQCPECSRLLLLDQFNNDFHVRSFMSEQAGNRHLLRSKYGEKWRQPLRGSWTGGKGNLYWGNGITKDSCEDFTEWMALENRYHDILTQLNSQNTLRDAILLKDGKVIHSWPSN